MGIHVPVVLRHSSQYTSSQHTSIKRSVEEVLKMEYLVTSDFFEEPVVGFRVKINKRYDMCEFNRLVTRTMSTHVVFQWPK